MSDEQEIEHGIAGGVYDNMARLAKGGEPAPRLECLCGFVTSPSYCDWAGAGEGLDEHLEEFRLADTREGPDECDHADWRTDILTGENWCDYCGEKLYPFGDALRLAAPTDKGESE